MRRGIAGLILGLSLVLASVSWAGFVMSRTVLDPGRSERLADQIFENEELRSSLADRIASALALALPSEVNIPPELIDQAAQLALDDPAVQQLVRAGIVDTHRAALEGNSEPVTIDAAALGSAGRSALVALAPELAASVPVIPELEVTLPIGGLSILGKVKDFVDSVTLICAIAALVGATAALVLSNNRPAILRRVSYWAFGAAAFWMVVGYGIPWLGTIIAPSSGAIVTAVVDVFFGAMIPPAITLALVGVALFGASFLWSAASSQVKSANHASASATPARATSAPATRVGVASNIRPPRQAPQQRGAHQQSAHQQSHAQPQHSSGQPRATQPGSPSNESHNHPSSAQAEQFNQADPTRVQPDPWAVTNPEQHSPPAPPEEWVDGVGYVDPDQPIR